jgi:hypothetical protein
MSVSNEENEVFLRMEPDVMIGNGHALKCHTFGILEE